jgi:hypothetical protein
MDFAMHDGVSSASHTEDAAKVMPRTRPGDRRPGATGNAAQWWPGSTASPSVQVAADTHTWSTSKWEVGIVWATSRAFRCETLWIKCLRILPKSGMAVHHVGTQHDHTVRRDEVASNFVTCDGFPSKDPGWRIEGSVRTQNMTWKTHAKWGNYLPNRQRMNARCCLLMA